MKKTAFVILMALSFAFVSIQSAFAWIEVPDYGDTGWQTYSHTFDQPWSGGIGFLVSNYSDEEVAPVLLIDNLNLASNDFSNAGFEEGDLSGYMDIGDAGVIDYAQADSGTEYYPTEGDYMAYLYADGDADMSIVGGTNGTVLILDDELSFEEGDIFSFDWAFLAFDYYPYQDFSMFFHMTSLDDESGLEFEELGRIGGGGEVVPEPASMSLLGLGLFGLAGLRRKKA